MPQILVKSKDPSIIPKPSRGKKPGYELIPVSPESAFEMLSPDNMEVHAIIVDKDLITPSEVMAIKEKMEEHMFPVILLCGELSEEEAGKWIGCGVSDIFQLPLPAAVMGKRVGSAVQLYCVTKSLHGQVTDKLTGLSNREAFYHFAKEMITKKPQDDYTVILSDIESFKRINERFGEKQGDSLLRYVGRTLSSLMNEDILFARYSGDQFVGILRCPKGSEEFSEESINFMMQKFYENAPIAHFNVQFGVYEHVDKDLPISIMCDRALMALNTIKHQYGRNLGRYTPQLQLRFDNELKMLDSMEEAITEKQFQIYYQPKHDIKTSEIIGAEALVRWNHPAYGFLSPADFIPLFEKRGFITKMDTYIWNTVCSHLKDMLDQGLPVVPVSVNVSRMDLVTEGFVEKLSKPVHELGLDPKLLHLELTESVYMEESAVLAPITEQIKNKGFAIELDDFGSGFSSLGNIFRLPVDVIKLDISFIRNLEDHSVMVEGLIRLMHDLNYVVIAEGVETDKQLEILSKMNCDAVQGYYFSKPLTLDGFRNYIAAHGQA